MAIVTSKNVDRTELATDTVKNRSIYLDNNATSATIPIVREEIFQTLSDAYGNPSSAHSAGEPARRVITAARESVAALLNCDAENLIFTGSGTESNNLALTSAIHGRQSIKIVTTTVEHASVSAQIDVLNDRQSVREVIYLPVHSNGLLDLNELERVLESKDTTLVAIQWVNSETGVIQPLSSIAALTDRYGAKLHVDAAQALGKITIDLRSLPVDSLSVTGHKINAPPGVGVLYLRQRHNASPIKFGGDQEYGLNPGTENVPGIAGFGAAARVRRENFFSIQKQLTELRDSFETCVLSGLPNVSVNGRGAPRVCNSTNLLFDGLDGQLLMARLDAMNVFCSQSSACTNQRPEPSSVLRAMGLSETQAYSSVRFSFGVTNNLDEAKEAASRVVKCVKDISELFKQVASK